MSKRQLPRTTEHFPKMKVWGKGRHYKKVRLLITGIKTLETSFTNLAQASADTAKSFNLLTNRALLSDSDKLVVL